MSTNLRVAVQNTMIVETGDVGKHYIFKISEQTDIGRKVIWKNKNAKHSQIEVRGNDHYVVTAPSRHPNGNLYKWNQRTPELLTDKEVEELILLVSSSDKSGIRLKNKIHATTITPTTSTTIVSKETLQMLLELIKPYYTAGSRNDIIYYLSGFMRKDGGFSLADTKEFVTLLCNWSKTSKYSDEDLEKSLQVVENTYSKPIDDLNGKSGLHELLVTTYESASSEEYQNGANTYKQILDIIVAVKNKAKEGKKNKPIRYSYSSRPKAWVELRIGEIIDEETGEMRQVRSLQEFKHIPEFDRATKQLMTKEVYGNVILAAVPVLSGQHEDGDDNGVGIHIVYDPLFKTEKYKMAFEYVDKQQDSGIRRTEVVGPVTITGLRRYLEEKTHFVLDHRVLTDRLNAMIWACKENGLAVYSEEIEPEGFFYLNGRIVSSKLNTKKDMMVTRESTRAALDAILKMQKEFFASYRDRRRLGHYLKLFTIGPFEYVRKQMNGVIDLYKWTPRGDLTGDTRGGKTEYGKIGCYIWRLDINKHVLPKRSIDSEARVIHTLGKTTMPLTFEEPDFLSGERRKKDNSEKIISILKNSVEILHGERLTTTHDEILEPYLAYYIITHNSKPISEDGATRRFAIDQFRKIDKKTDKIQIDRYTHFIYDNLDTIGGIGDFITWYVCEVNPEVLRNDWVTASRHIWCEMWKYAGFPEKEFPEWLHQTIEDSSVGGTGLSDTDLDDQRREMLRSAFKKFFTKLWEAARYEYTQDTQMPIGNVTLINQITWLVDKGKVPACIPHPTKGIYFTSDIINVLRPYGLSEDDRIKFTDLEELCGFTPAYFKPRGGKSMRAHSVLPKDLVEFIQPLISVSDIREEEREETKDVPYKTMAEEKYDT